MAQTEMVPLSKLLHQIQEASGISLYPNNLTTTHGRERSIMQQLANEGLAQLNGRRWLVSPMAVERLLALTRGGRPGPGPGAQATLDANQVRAFAEAMVADQSTSIHDALATATGWSREVIDKIERVVIPVAPRMPIK